MGTNTVPLKEGAVTVPNTMMGAALRACQKVEEPEASTLSILGAGGGGGGHRIVGTITASICHCGSVTLLR